MPTSTDDSAVEQQPLSEEEAFQLGVRAYVYAYPLLVMDSRRRVTTNVLEPQVPSPMSQFAHHWRFPGASDRTIAGASLDTLYSLAWLDLSHEPYVLDVPAVEDRFYMMPILDGWTK
jgi:hypothetical protein